MTATPAWPDALVASRPEPARDGDPPDDGALGRILAAAGSVPDHGGLRPWRFVVVAGPARQRMADALVAGLRVARGPGQPDVVVEKMRGKAFAAPCAVVIVSSPVEGSNVPVWEQEASAACTGYAMVLAATGLGLGAVWKSAAVLDTGPVRAAFGLTSSERILGWVNLGTPDPAGERGGGGRRPVDDRVSVLAPPTGD